MKISLAILAASASLLLPLDAVAAEAKSDAPAKAEAKVKAKAKKPAAGKSEVLLRGEPLKGAPVVAFAELMKNPEAHAGKTIQVEADVRKACSKKGCWMELSDGKGAGMRVKFKDYGFFVPLDAQGAKAKVEGELKIAELSEGSARHFEKEGATIPRGADGKPREVQMVATGVELRR